MRKQRLEENSGDSRSRSNWLTFAQCLNWDSKLLFVGAEYTMPTWL